MVTADFLITNAKIASPSGIYEASIAINKGKILAIGHDSHLPKAKNTFKANGRLVMPCVIDGHTHLWEPGWTYRDDFRTGTRG
ncbi:MAG: allantoinase, partial [Candidatus Bathyarchaeia archaeon]